MDPPPNVIDTAETECFPPKVRIFPWSQAITAARILLWPPSALFGVTLCFVFYVCVCIIVFVSHNCLGTGQPPPGGDDFFSERLTGLLARTLPWWQGRQKKNNFLLDSGVADPPWGVVVTDWCSQKSHCLVFGRVEPFYLSKKKIHSRYFQHTP